MACESWKERILERVCDEIDPDEAARLEGHLRVCAACREDLARLAETRGALREAEPAVPIAPRVVVLESSGFRRPFPAFAAGIACGAIAIALAFWAGRSGAPDPIGAEPSAKAPDVVRKTDLEAALASERNRFDRRIDEVEAIHRGSRPAAAMLTRQDLEAALGRLERRLETRRASDVDWLLQEITASELRSGERIGQTREALRYVALASDPRVTAQ